VPEYENGYYLASYRCICKENHEFPFIDYGSSYFEGATVEKEYDKKVKGQPNIYDRLKCRPITIRNYHGRQYWNGATKVGPFGIKFIPKQTSFIFIVISILSNFLLYSIVG
jgi:hypothetical protein